MLTRHHRALPNCVCQMGLILRGYLEMYLWGLGSFCYVLHWTLCPPFARSCHRRNHSKTKSRCSHQICWLAVCIHSWGQRGLGCDHLCQSLMVFVCFFSMWTQGQLNKMLAGNLGVFSVWLEKAWESLLAQDHGVRLWQFTFQGCLKPLLPREEILEWKDKLKIDRLIACDS